MKINFLFNFVSILLGLLLSATALNAQTTIADYKRADSLFNKVLL